MTQADVSGGGVVEEGLPKGDATLQCQGCATFSRIRALMLVFSIIGVVVTAAFVFKPTITSLKTLMTHGVQEKYAAYDNGCQYDIHDSPVIPLDKLDCPEEVVLAWLQQGMVVTNELPGNQAYIACAGAGSTEEARKVSCDESDCGEDVDWCYIIDPCNSGLTPESSALHCSEVPLAYDRATSWDLRTSQHSSVPKPYTQKQIALLLTGPNAPLPVGEGWSFWLGQRTPTRPIFKLRDNWQGAVPSQTANAISASLLNGSLINGDAVVGSVNVKAGTTFGELKHVLSLTNNMALHDRVQFDQVSMGGALHTGAHGWSTKKLFIETITYFEGIEIGTGKSIAATRGTAQFWDTLFSENVAILSADMETMNNQLICVRQNGDHFAGSYKDSVKALEERNGGTELFEPPFAMLFIDANGLLYMRGTYYDEDDLCWQNAKKQPADSWTKKVRLVWEKLNGWFGHMGKLFPEYDEINTVGSGHTKVESLGWLEMYGGNAVGVDYNVEILLDFQPGLIRMVEVFAKFHIDIGGGRTEIRQRVRGGSTVVYLDLALGPHIGVPGVTKFLETLYSQLGVRTVAFHTGKYIPTDAGPLEVKSLADFWKGASDQVISQ